MNNPLLSINNLSVSIDDTTILNGIDLQVQAGSIHVLMGPNGSGKSTLAYTLMGHPHYCIKNGSLFFKGEDITTFSPDKRAREGIFLSLQNPCEIPGVSVFSLLKESYGAIKKQRIDVSDFQCLVQEKMDMLGLDSSFLSRNVHEGFSGGEKKRFELLQLLLLNPTVAILDEIDSGLDVDALSVVARNIISARMSNPKMALILITHYQRLLSFIKPDHVHVLVNGTVVASGDNSLVNEIEQHGYSAFIDRTS